MVDRLKRSGPRWAVGLFLAMGIVAAIPEIVLGQTQPHLTTQQTAPLQKTRLNQKIIKLFYEGNYQKITLLAEHALSINENAFGAHHPDVAITLDILALLYSVQGQYGKAEPLFLRSLNIFESKLGKDHLDVAISLDNLAEMYRNQGRYDKAEPLYLRALSILETKLGKDADIIGIHLENLASLYRTQGRYDKAEPLYLRALSILETKLGKDPFIANILNNLAEIYRKQERYDKAEPFYLRALSIFEFKMSEDHSYTAISLIWGKDHPYVAINLNGLARLYYAQGNLPRAVQWLNLSLSVQETDLTRTLAFGSEQSKEDYINILSGTTYFPISLALQSASDLPSADRLALTTVLRRKGRVLDAVSASMQTLLGQQANNPEAQKLYTDLRNVWQQKSNLTYCCLGNQKLEQYNAALYSRLTKESDRLESAVSRLSSEFRKEIQLVELSAVQQQIPKDAVLIEIVQYFPYNSKAKQSDQWGEARYAAAILRPIGDPIWKDLGDVAAIDKAAQEFREALKNPDSTIDPSAQALEKLLITPLRPYLGNTRHLLISPDGQLSLIPFEALRNRGKYLIQEYDISYLTTGRDLLRFPNFVASQNQPALFADINYIDAEIVQPTALKTGTRGSENPESINLDPVQQLSYTKAEAEAIQPLFGFQSFTDRNATETALKQLVSPSILHLSTHAFFLPDQKDQPKAALSEISSTSAISSEFTFTIRPQSPKPANPENPLLRSGIALAGFNERSKQRSTLDDGVLTSLEVAALNLHGTQLVVLSACETGLGDIKIGEGVYGLRRALVIAGSESQVLSLWQVRDDASQILMTHYYQNLKAGKGRHEALKLAQLHLLNDENYSHPYYWSAFLFSGNWRPLTSK